MFGRNAWLKRILIKGAPTCGDGDVDETVTMAVVKLINDRRTALVDGTQPNGKSGQNLPPAKSMTAIVSYYNINSNKHTERFSFIVISRRVATRPIRMSFPLESFAAVHMGFLQYSMS